MITAHASPKASRGRTVLEAKQYSSPVDSRYISKSKSGREKSAKKKKAEANSGLQLQAVNPLSIAHAAPRDWARKKIHARQTTLKMKILLIHCHNVLMRSVSSFRKRRSAARPPPCS